MNIDKYAQIKTLVKSQVPEFVRENHPLFVDFLVAYYEWMSQNDQVFVKSSFGDSITTKIDIDQTIQDFFEYFFKQYLVNFPPYLLVDEKNGQKLNPKTVLKNIKKFFSAKGTEKSYRFLFRILYNSEISFKYPKNLMLRLSDSRWSQKTFLRIRKTDGLNEYDMTEKYVFQKEDILDPYSKYKARAKITKVKQFTTNNVRVVELDLEQLEGSFQTNENIYCNVNGRVVMYGKVSPILSRIVISDPGEGYSVNDKFVFSSPQGGRGVSPSAYVSRVISFGNISGKIKEITIEDPGFNVNFYNISSIDAIAFGASGFSGSMETSSIFIEKGRYLDGSEHLSSNRYIQDNYYYQDYSYVIRTDKVLNEYERMIKDLLHPAGLELFGEALINKCLLGEASSFIKVVKKNVKRIGNYLPYTFVTFNNLSSWFTVDGVPKGYSPSEHDDLIRCGYTDSSYGPIGASCSTGNPITSGITFPIAATADCLSADIEEGMYPSSLYGYWVTYDHPNRLINRQIIDPAFVYIHPDQLEDFYGAATAGSGQSSSGWQEWIYSTTRLNIPSKQIQFFQDLYDSVDPLIAPLMYSDSAQFRKISIESFINDLICDYDCRENDECVSEINNRLTYNQRMSKYYREIKSLKSDSRFIRSTAISPDTSYGIPIAEA